MLLRNLFGLSCCDGGDEAAVQPSAEEYTERYLGHQSFPNSCFESLPQFHEVRFVCGGGTGGIRWIEVAIPPCRLEVAGGALI
jgi:hypothetical protein